MGMLGVCWEFAKEGDDTTGVKPEDLIWLLDTVLILMGTALMGLGMIIPTFLPARQYNELKLSMIILT
ncbi:hypothetical protein E2C01_021718 [Portunus trituberculatus]|uniref:Uncharacterized protein n=1 Tax=Portunus trituberculatus TaxID=210409 RepID=A0A5B7E5G8_PORTR|nr:hypothetical protein [Portunus trituberculatus]